MLRTFKRDGGLLLRLSSYLYFAFFSKVKNMPEEKDSYVGSHESVESDKIS